MDWHAAQVAQARATVRRAGLYGDVAVDQLHGARLPYIDNLVNLLVSDDLGDVPMSEVMRVLTPAGAAYIRESGRWQKIVKRRPDNIDDWTHFLHDASGNAVAHDDVVGPPRHLQWLGSPRWSRHHDRMASMSALVSAGGRIFYIMDEGSRISIQMPPKWMLVARDAFNGTVLWKQPVKTWHNHLWPLKSGPTQLARRLVATEETVYVTLGLREPLTALDAKTGEVLHTYAGTKPTEEVLWHDGKLFALVNSGAYSTSDYEVQLNLGDQARVRTAYLWNEQPREIVAVDPTTTSVVWQAKSPVAPLTMAVDSASVFFHTGEKLACLDRDTGQEKWVSAAVGRRPNVTMNFGPKLLVNQGVVLFAGGDRSMRAFDAESGKPMWTAPHARGGYQSPEDLLVVGGLVWSAPTTRTRDSGVFTGRDLLTGEVKIEFPPNVDTYWFHHRCYIAKATDKFLLPSRTGVEFVDYEKQDWNINHWVRGGCLYGVMPCNGLLYAPPHNCACYPEAKLYGLNALAPASSARQLPSDVSEQRRLERGPAYSDAADAQDSASDWPTYRHDAARSGIATTSVPAELERSWRAELGGRLSSVVVAAGRLYVAQIDAHCVHALDAESGDKLWSFTAGARVDSPPTVYRGRLLFGSSDGSVYCLRAADGKLVWRFRAAPRDERLMAFEQLESVWPVHGTVLIKNDVVYFVAGRSNFLDGRLRFFRLDVHTGRKISESVMDDRDPVTGEDIQNHLQVLNMPVGLPDILSSDGAYVYMRSQQFDLEGNRIELGPHSGDPAQQGSVQRGQAAHLFAPMGFLDDTWFHRSYWVYGRSFAGGHGGYYQAGKYTPSGRILLFDDDTIYGFGRKPQYYKWTTTIEHQLFAASSEPPEEAREETGKGAGGGTTMVRFAKTNSLNPKGTPLAVEAWVKADRREGVILARGGPAQGFALLIRQGKPRFVTRVDSVLSSVTGRRNITNKWTHLVGVLTADKKLHLYVNGKLAGSAKGTGLISADPAQAMEIGADDRGAVGNYRSPLGFTGLIDEVKVYLGQVSGADVQQQFEDPKSGPPAAAKLVLSCTFDDGDARDASGNGNHGNIVRARHAQGQFGKALQLVGRPGRGGGSFVDHRWTKDVPLLVRAMLKAGDTLFLAGPPDLIDEEQTFQRLVRRDPRVGEKLAEQDAALLGSQGGVLQLVSAANGRTLAEHRLDSLPVWDGLAAANGRLYLSTTDGSVLCFSGREEK